jgi:PAS domain S-box-containing protein
MEDGRPLRVLGVAQDVTERKRDEEERERLLEESERRAAELDAVIRGIPDAVYVGDEAGIRVCNDAALRMLGFESVEEMNRSISLLSERLENRFAATGRRIPPEEEPFARALKGETVVEEVVARHLKTGRDVIVRCAAAPIVREGEIVGAVAVNSDVTEQKKAQERLAYHAHLLENTDDAVIATDERFVVKAWNRGAVEMYGWTVDEAVDRPVHEVIAPDLTDEQRDETLRELADSGRSRNEIVTHRKDGTSVYIEGITVALRGEQGHVTGYLSINRDVGERKRVEEALLEIREGERRRIARDLHDVVLQDLAAALQAVQATRIRSAEPHEELGQAADILRSTARSLRGVIHDLRLEEGQQFVKAVEALAAGLGHRLAPESEVDIGVESGFPQELPGDLGAGLLRIIREALANALRHSGARRIDVALRSREGWVAIEVTDDGRGFDLDAIEGSSFGLWAMEERARALGAKLEVRSAAGGGTKVSVEASAGPRGDQG